MRAFTEQPVKTRLRKTKAAFRRTGRPLGIGGSSLNRRRFRSRREGLLSVAAASADLNGEGPILFEMATEAITQTSAA